MEKVDGSYRQLIVNIGIIVQFSSKNRHSSFVTLHFSGKNNKRLMPKLPEINVLELIRKDFISKKCKLFFGLCDGCRGVVRFVQTPVRNERMVNM